MSVTVVLGGARSGKSVHAEGLISALPSPWIYLATGASSDDEMLNLPDDPEPWLPAPVLFLYLKPVVRLGRQQSLPSQVPPPATTAARRGCVAPDPSYTQSS